MFMGAMDRLLKVINEKKISIKQFSTMMGYPNTSRVSNWKMRGAMPLRLAPRAALALGISAEWLITGEGKPDEIGDSISMDQEDGHLLAEQMMDMPRSRLKILQAAHIEIPIYDVRASAGAGAFVDAEETAGVLTVAKLWARQNIGYVEGVLNMIYVEGDSMHPTLTHGDMIIIDRATIQVHDFSDGIHVIRLGQKIMVKRLQMLPKGVIMAMSDNPLYQPFELRDDDDFAVLGKVRWAWKGVKVS